MHTTPIDAIATIADLRAYLAADPIVTISDWAHVLDIDKARGDFDTVTFWIGRARLRRPVSLAQLRDREINARAVVRGAHVRCVLQGTTHEIRTYISREHLQAGCLPSALADLRSQLARWYRLTS